MNRVFACEIHASIFTFVYRRETMKHGSVCPKPACIYVRGVVMSLSSVPECAPQLVHRFTSGGAIIQRGPSVIAVAAADMNSGALSLCLKR